MDVRYEVESSHKGRFWLESCGALLDVEPHGQDLVFTMCHTIEDPTFDATAVATNRRAQTRPVHRPPRHESVDPLRPHCEWTVTIDPSHDPVADHPLVSRVEQSALAGLEIRRPSADPDDDGLALYDGPVLAEPQLELFSRDALVVICKEVAVQVHLLVRALGLSLADAVGTEKATEILEAEMVGSGWIMSERLARLLDVPAATGRPRRDRDRPVAAPDVPTGRVPAHRVGAPRAMRCTFASSTAPPAPTTTGRAGVHCCDRAVTMEWLPPYRPSTGGPGSSRPRVPRFRRGQSPSIPKPPRSPCRIGPPSAT